MKFVKSAALGAALVFGLASGVVAQDLKFFTIGTGGTAATYYPVGGVIANAISNPPGSRPCEEGGSCGVPGLIASAVSSRGSVDNLNAITSGLRNSGFAQSDVAYWAYTGTGTVKAEYARAGQWKAQQHADQGAAGVKHQADGDQRAEQVGVIPLQVQLLVGHEHDRPTNRRQHSRYGEAEKLPRITAQAYRQARFEKHVAVEKHQQAHTENHRPDHHVRSPENLLQMKPAVMPSNPARTSPEPSCQ